MRIPGDAPVGGGENDPRGLVTHLNPVFGIKEGGELDTDSCPADQPPAM